MKPYAFSAASIDQLEPGIKDYVAQGFTPTLALVFSSVDHNLEEIRKIFANHNIDIFGGSSCGEIVNGRVLEKSISVMLLDIDRRNYSVKIFDIDVGLEYQSGKNAGDWALSVFKNP